MPGPLKVPLFRPSFSAKEMELIAEVLASGHVTSGPKCCALEAMFSRRLGGRHCVALNSCTAALHLALAAAGIGPGDLVFVPTLAFAADYQAVEMVKARAVLVDCERETLCMDPAKLAETVEALAGPGPRHGGEGTGGRPAAVVAIDYAGQMADYGPLLEICRRWGMLLVEDAAHALPAAWRPGPDAAWHDVGTVADLTCFSFYASKTMTTGEGGMLATQNPRWAEQAECLRLHGLRPRSDVPHRATWDRQICQEGFKYNLPDLAAAVGICQFERLDELWHARQNVAAQYAQRLAGCGRLRLPRELPDRRHSWHLYTVRLPPDTSEAQRNELIDRLFDCGIQTSVHWYPLHLHDYIRAQRPYHRDLSTAEEAYRTMVSLPLYPAMSAEQVDYVCDHLLRLVGA